MSGLSPIYTTQSVFTTATPTTEIPKPSEVWEWLQEGMVLLWTHAGLGVGEVRNQTVEWKKGKVHAGLEWKDHLVELRAFNADKEWRILASGQGRKRCDQAQESAKKMEVVTSCMSLRGVVGKSLQEKSESLGLYTQHYMAQNPIGMTQYVDVRFVKIVSKSEGGTP